MLQFLFHTKAITCMQNKIKRILACVAVVSFPSARNVNEKLGRYVHACLPSFSFTFRALGMETTATQAKGFAEAAKQKAYTLGITGLICHRHYILPYLIRLSLSLVSRKEKCSWLFKASIKCLLLLLLDILKSNLKYCCTFDSSRTCHLRFGYYGLTKC